MTRMRWAGRGVWEAVAVATELVLLAVLSATVGVPVVGWLVGTAVAVVAVWVLSSGLVRQGVTRLGPANQVTLARTLLSAGVAALVAGDLTSHPSDPLLITGLAAVSLSLDVVDGAVARRTGQATPLGARFDMEADAFLLIVLSLHLAPVYGWWVVVIAAMRYVFVAAALALPWLASTLPRRPSRRLIAATTGVILVVASSLLLPGALARSVLAVALCALMVSFGRDVIWLAAHRSATGKAQTRPME
ncbi:MAG: CDP-alcohol phosphatidyltransferase family protein [Propionibacteriaceae bacterium]